MSYVERHEVNVSTGAGGTGVGYTPVITGRVLAIAYVKDATAPYDASVDFNVTVESTTQQVWKEDNVNATTSRLPRAGTHDTIGTALVYTVANPVCDYIAVANDRIKIAVAAGGASHTGAFHVYIG